ncbi:6-carboxytetrahydropterin synthase QueD [Candidatus Bathyarchaeota archaeon]|jgi:6-pyruvoyltetrahydropterin/6-carboxytetrahydropterin synthase|nr:6-carboxytetrahydropterin synthase QueD [Candidatus Bathyarchaeota archaeon]
MKYSVTKVFEFAAAHYLTDYDGPCSRMHGHTYKLEITVGRLELQDGMVMDFGQLKSIVNEKIIDKLDHQMLNDRLSFRTTAENMSVWIWGELRKGLRALGLGPPVYMRKVKLWETPTSFAEVTQ